MSYTSNDYRHFATEARRAIRHHELKYRERLLCEIVIDYSLALDRLDAYIPTQRHLNIITGLGKSHISTALSELRKNRVLAVDDAAGLYTLNLDFAAWKVPSSFREDAWHRAALRTEQWLTAAARVTSEQLPLLEPLPDLDALMAEETRIELLSTRQAPAPGTGEQHHAGAITRGPQVSYRGGEPDTINSHRDAPPACGDHSAHSPAGLPVGDALTARIRESLELAESSQIGNSQVPESGTRTFNAFNASNSLHLNVSTKCAVPDLGTAHRKPTIESELLAEIERRCGPASRKFGGWWRLRIRENPPAVREALGDLAMRIRDPNLRPLKNPGAWLRDRFERITKHQHA